MALDTLALLDVSEFRTLTGRQQTDDTTKIASLLLSMTRVVERRTGVARGMFRPQSSLTFTFNAYGGSLLRLRDEDGRQLLLRSIDADSLAIDSDADGTYDDYTLDFADAWVRGYPLNASAFGEPFTGVRLRAVNDATITLWPDMEASVQITGDWGWAATPPPLKDRVAGMAHELLGTHHAGASWTTSDVEVAMNDIPRARALMIAIEREYNYRLRGPIA